MTLVDRARSLLYEWNQYKDMVPNNNFENAIDLEIEREALSQLAFGIGVLITARTKNEEMVLDLVEKFEPRLVEFRNRLIINVLTNGTTNRSGH